MLNLDGHKNCLLLISKSNEVVLNQLKGYPSKERMYGQAWQDYRLQVIQTNIFGSTLWLTVTIEEIRDILCFNSVYFLPGAQKPISCHVLNFHNFWARNVECVFCITWYSYGCISLHEMKITMIQMVSKMPLTTCMTVTRQSHIEIGRASCRERV